MEFGKVNNWLKIDFGLPKQPAFNQIVLATEPCIVNQGKLFIGGTAWSEPLFKGNLYPSTAKTTDFLKYYVQQFNCIEANSTFYQLPSSEMILKWKSQVPLDFKFCFKVPAWISRDSQLGIGSNKWIEFFNSLALLEQNFGILFLQLPESFDTKKIKVLERFLLELNCPYQLAIEFRQKDWFIEGMQWLELLHSFNVSAVITDVAGRRDACHMGLSTKKSFVRFVANESDEIIENRIHNWGKQLKDWFREGVNELYFFIHQSDPKRIKFTRNLLLDAWSDIGLISKNQIVQDQSSNRQTQLF